jgi:hypothetical protein
VKSGNVGQLPSAAGSPPIRTHCEYEGVGPSRTKSWNHPGGQTFAFGGAVMVQELPLQLKAGNKTRLPKLLPCVLETAVRTDQRTAHRRRLGRYDCH